MVFRSNRTEQLSLSTSKEKITDAHVSIRFFITRTK
nr:MAG TPA: hypothetical protein [Bacteriophage sp.]